MVRTTIYLPDNLKAALEARAAADGRTESDLIREALAEKLRQSGRTARDIRFGLADSGTSTTSTDVDDILSQTEFGTE